ncbi:MAG: potassium-transporting ATPase subunit KdpA [Deltaproteobacteria bacterium]|jgi:K+-transporting ATPase ATPase A chain|nr:potassium-transporting ATPase subunit KdpA [Deltaproteobacteria bacterium]
MRSLQVWLLPASITLFTILVAFPLSRYMAWIMDGRYRAPRLLRWIEARLDSGAQDWKQYAVSLLVFNTLLFVYGYAVLALQPWMPLNPQHKGMLAPSTIFNSVASFMTNTNLQHYSGEVHLSNFSQVFFVILNQFVSASVGLCALTAIIRAFRGASRVGNYFVDMWRAVAYLFLPAALLLGVLFVSQGAPMTFASSYQVGTLEPNAMGTADNGQAKAQTLVVGPVAAEVPIMMLGTNGGGFYGMNEAHPYANPTAVSNFFVTFAMMVFPFALVLMYGRMLGRRRHSWVIFLVMLLLFVGTIGWAVWFDTLRGNPGLTAHQERALKIASAGRAGAATAVRLPATGGLPVDQHLGNLEGKELRFGTSAGATFGAVTVDVTCGAINCEQDSLNPLAGLSPMVGMWLNCIFGGKGVGMINLLLFLVIGVFLAGQMVGRTPEYLGRKIGAREMKLAVVALLVHPLLILGPSGLFAATAWGQKAEGNPGAHGFSEIVYQFSSASANNGSAFDGLGVTYGFNDNPNPSPEAVPWDLATGLVMLFSRYLPILAPMALAASLGLKKAAPSGLGTLRDDTFTFGCLLFGTIVIVGALLFMPVAALGPLAEHLGPIPFGG